MASNTTLFNKLKKDNPTLSNSKIKAMIREYYSDVLEDPNYKCRVKTIHYTTVDKDGKERKRTRTKVLEREFQITNRNKRNVLAGASAMSKGKYPGFRIGISKNSGNEPSRKRTRHGDYKVMKNITSKNKRGVLVRGFYKTVINRQGMRMIKEGLGRKIINSKGKLLSGYRKQLCHFPS